MNKISSRRHFLKTSLGTGLALAGLRLGHPSRTNAVEPIKRSGKARLALSMAAYSFRQYLTERDPARRITLFDFIDYCADHGCVGTELTSYYFPENPSVDFLLQVRRHTFLRGLAISGTAVGNNFVLPKGDKLNQQIASVKQWVDRAAIMGAPHIRVFAGTLAAGTSPSEAKASCIDALDECAEYAGTKGIFLGLENHGGIVAEPDDLLAIVRAVKSPWLGINLDTGNFHTANPYADLAACAPYAVNVQFKSEVTPRGKKKEPADLARLVQILHDADYQGYVALEYEAAEDPYQAVPGILKSMKDLFAS
ncbi:MAG: sugar phosphate isomerase/epimerase [Candidatus Omnitrophica bacterium]|nr:sugar phosphate isomerase/epimerase [Candidatus Omnitrophota bacterium]